MAEKTTRSGKAAATKTAAKTPVVKTRTAKAVASRATNSARVAAPTPAQAAIEAAAAAVAPRAPAPAKAAEAVAPQAAPAVLASAAAPSFAPQAVPAPVAALLQTGADQARDTFARMKASTESLRQAAAESATATSRGVIEVNEKLIEAARAQSDAAFELWRSALSANSVSEAIRIQSAGARQVYETATSQWKDIAEMTGRLFTASVKPIQSAWTVQGR